MWQVQSIFDGIFLGCVTREFGQVSIFISFGGEVGARYAAASVAANLGICRAKWTCGRLPRLGHDRWMVNAQKASKGPPNFTNIMPNRRFRAALKAVVYCTIWRSNESGIGFVCLLWGIWQLSTMARVARECPILIDRRTAQRSLKRQALSEAGIGGRAKGRRRWRNSKSDSARDCVENTVKPSNHYVHLTPREQFWGVTSVKRRWGCSRQLKEVDSFRFAMRKGHPDIGGRSLGRCLGARKGSSRIWCSWGNSSSTTPTTTTAARLLFLHTKSRANQQLVGVQHKQFHSSKVCVMAMTLGLSCQDMWRRITGTRKEW